MHSAKTVTTLVSIGFFPQCTACDIPMRLESIEPHVRLPAVLDVRHFACDACSRTFDEPTPRNWLGTEHWRSVIDPSTPEA
jgi:hypothetical protein